MQTWHLAPGISFCVNAGVPIFLDLVRDRYVALPERLRAPFLDWQTAPCRPMPQGLELLEREGLVAQGSSGPPIVPVRLEKADRPLLPVAAVDSFAAAPQMIASHVRINRVLRRGGITGPLAAVAPTPPAPADMTTTKRLARRFATVERVLSLRRNCLHGSLVLLDYLRRRGADAEIVFGVTSSPFRAHCWIQRDGWTVIVARSSAARSAFSCSRSISRRLRPASICRFSAAAQPLASAMLYAGKAPSVFLTKPLPATSRR